MTLFLVLLVYSWCIYPAILLMVGFFLPAIRLKASPLTSGIALNPVVSIVIPVFDGERVIEAKVKNCLAQQYKGKFEVIIISDGSSDRTSELALTFKEKNISFIELESRMGKSAAQNQGVIAAKGDFVLLTDVDSVLTTNALQIMMDTFNSTKGIGCVGARVEFEAANLFQRLYWFIETEVRLAESRLGVLSSVSGAAMLIEKKVFRPLDLDTGDDMVIPLDLRLHNRLTTVYTSDVLVGDHLAKGSRDILNSRRRITRRNLLAISRRVALLNPFKFGFVSVSILSRKVSRWFTPFFLLGAIVPYLYLHDARLLVYVLFVTVALALYFRDKSIPVLMEVFGLSLGVYDFARGYKTKGY